jgi:hypothetical protein
MVTTTAVNDLAAIGEVREQELEEARIIQGAMLPAQPLHQFDISFHTNFNPSPRLAGITSTILSFLTAPLACI